MASRQCCSLGGSPKRVYGLCEPLLTGSAQIPAQASKGGVGKTTLTSSIAKNGVETAVRDKAADKGRRENCRMLLQSAVDAAQREVAADVRNSRKLRGRNLKDFEDRHTAARALVASLERDRQRRSRSPRSHLPARFAARGPGSGLTLAVPLSADSTGSCHSL